MTAHPVSAEDGAPTTAPNGQWLTLAALRILPPDQSPPFSRPGRPHPEADPPEASGFAACALRAGLQAACDARLFARSTLESWELGLLVDDTTVIVSELVSNAVRYGLAGPRRLPASPHPVWLGMLRQGRTVVCSVSDPSREVPVIREPDFLAESGRGLHLIESLSEAWGWTPPDRAGKSVWAMVSAAEGAP